MMNPKMKFLPRTLFLCMFFFSLLKGETYNVEDKANSVHYTIELPVQFAKGKGFHKTENLIFQCQTEYFLIYFSHGRLKPDATLADATSKLLKVIKEQLSSEGLKILDLKRRVISINGSEWIKLDYKAGKTADKKNSVHQVIYTSIDSEIMYMAIGTCLEFERAQNKVLRDVVKSLNIQPSTSAQLN